MRSDQKIQVWCLWCGPVFAALFGIGVVLLAGFLPPPSPHDSAREIVEVYRSDLDAIRLGTVAMMLGVPFLVPWACAIAAQTYRAEKGFPILTVIQLIAAGVVTLIIAAFSLIWAVAAFRPGDISAETTQTLNDIGWFLFLFDWSPLALWTIAFAVAILRDNSATPAFPRWAAYLNVWVALGSLPGGLIVFFKDGPIAWNGVIGCYIPVAVFFVWLVAITTLTLKAIRRQPEAASTDELWAREQIRDCLYRYSRGIDRYDVELVRSCYHADATDAHGVYNGDLEGFIGLVHEFRGPDSPYGTMQHVITNTMIERAGDVAHVESYLYNPLTPREPAADLPDILVGGRFIDRFECRDGRWAIADRRLVFDYSRIRPATAKMWEQWPAGDVLLGRPNGDDPLYDAR